MEKSTKTTAKAAKPSNTSSNDLNATVSQANNFLEDLFLRKAPALPTNVKEAIVKYGPYITLIILLLSLPGLLFVLGVSALLAPVSYYGGVSSGLHFSFSVVFLIITLVLEALAVPGLIKRRRSGWNLAYYAALLNAVYNLVSLNIVSFLISTALSLWILFQIREYYK
ncbi:chromate transporter [Patescibacteria group bacterium]|nr:chromate transporter [Patescibacteria group bacterium]